jgi:protein-tyrosine phosphatase
VKNQGFVDLHSHWIPGIDDGVRTPEDGVRLLEGLAAAGFATVVATPHMRPGMFENDRRTLEAAYGAMAPALEAATGTLPAVYLASEHFFDEIVFVRLCSGAGLPYPGGGAVLVEFPSTAFPAQVQARFYDLKRARLTPVLAHPERYGPVWNDDAVLDPLLDAGAHLLLDLGSLVGKYGRAAQRAAEKLVGEDAYEAACSDAHKPEDVEWVVRAIERLRTLVGDHETERLLRDGPRGILLEGTGARARPLESLVS